MLEASKEILTAQLIMLRTQYQMGAVFFPEESVPCIENELNDFERIVSDFQNSSAGRDEICKGIEALNSALVSIDTVYRPSLACSLYLSKEVSLHIARKALSSIPKGRFKLRDKQGFLGWTNYFFGFNNTSTVIPTAYDARNKSQADRSRVVHQSIDMTSCATGQRATPLEQAKGIVRRRGVQDQYVQQLTDDPTGWRLVKWYVERYKNPEEIMRDSNALSERAKHFLQKGATFAQARYKEVWQLTGAASLGD